MHISNREHSEPAAPRLEPVTPPYGYPASPYLNAPQDDEFNLVEFLKLVARRKWQILAFVVVGTLLGLIASLYMPRKYKAEVTLMPITSSGGGGMAGVASQLSSMPMVGGALGDLGKLGGGKSKELVNILKSRTIAEQMIKQFDLLKVIFAKQYDAKTNTFHPGFPAFLKPTPVLEDGVNRFRKKITKIEEEKKSGLIKLQVTFNDPALAAHVANAMVIDLQNFIENNSLTVSKRNRIFLEEQLVKTRAKLLEAGKDLNQIYAENRISSVLPQVDVDVGSFQRAPKPFAEFQDEFDQLTQEQKVAEEKQEQAKVGRVPGQVYLQYLTLNRELLSKTYALLTQQYEFAKIDEAKEDLAFQVIDRAQVKVRSDSPDLVMNLAIGLMGGLIFGILVAVLRDKLSEAKAATKSI